MRKFLLLSCFILGFTSCEQTSTKEKPEPGETAEQIMPEESPFAEALPKTQKFEIDPLNDQVFKTNSGAIFLIPANTFLDKNGSYPKGKVVVEIAELTSEADRILANVTSSTIGEATKTLSTFYINAYSNGEALSIKKGGDITAEIPVETTGNSVEHFTGKHNGNHEIQWTKEPKPIEYLIPVKLDLLNFYPPGFEDEVESRLPFFGHTTSSSDFLDSLYYHLTPEIEFFSGEITPADSLVYPAFNPNTVNLNYQNYGKDSTITTTAPAEQATSCGINPLSIKTIRTGKFEGTLLATREFETRMKTIHKTGKQNILDIYINNLDKNLWECDSMAMISAGGTEWEKDFEAFKNERKTSTRESPKSSLALSAYYSKMLLKNKEKLEAVQQKKQKELIEHGKAAEQTLKEYKTILADRQEYRLNRVGLSVKKMGWHTVHEIVKNWGNVFLDVTIENGNSMERIYTYLVQCEWGSIFSILSDDKVHFNRCYTQDHIVPTRKNQREMIVTVGYIKDSVFYNEFEYVVEETNYVRMKVEYLGDIKDLRKKLGQIKTVGKFNSIIKDLSYQFKIYRENEFRKQEWEKSKIMNNLKRVAFKTCITAERLLKQCSACHGIFERMVGPPLANARKNALQFSTLENFYLYIQNPAAIIAKGDPYYVNVFREFNKSPMPPNDITREEIDLIFNYIESMTPNNYNK